jgi:hypothetical protein
MLEHLNTFMEPAGEGVDERLSILHKTSSSRYDLHVLIDVHIALPPLSDATRTHVSTSKDAPTAYLPLHV